MKPIVVTMGKPHSISPEIIVKAWLARHTSNLPPFYVIGQPDIFRQAFEICNAPSAIKCLTKLNNVSKTFANALPVYALPNNATSPQEATIGAIELAVGHTLDGHARGMVTAPINKSDLYEAGFKFPGHTEFLGHLCHISGFKDVKPIMCLSAKGLYVIPQTVHIPLKDVASSLNTKDIIDTVTIVNRDLSHYLQKTTPRIAIAGLNPHAGEMGTMGQEELEIIVPAIEKLKTQGMNVSGPHPADTLFHESKRKTYDVVLGMYHDQVLIPVKMLGFDEGVNTTLGLPFVRTSPDHGTAENIYKKNHANPLSMIRAIQQAAQWSHSKATL